jgi:hypothetical protein
MNRGGGGGGGGEGKRKRKTHTHTLHPPKNGNKKEKVCWKNNIVVGIGKWHKIQQQQKAFNPK